MLNNLKGWFGEKATQAGMWLKLDEHHYRRFHDLIIETKLGTTQIDHVVLSPYGLFVIETKNYKGWIYGGKDQKFWTQSFGHTKFKFQNPLHQNYKHTMALSEFLNIDHDKVVHSIVFFIGEAEFKTEMPPNVLASGLSAYIKTFNNIVFPYTKFAILEQKLLNLSRNGTISSKEHVQNLEERYCNFEICPKCGDVLIQRTAKKGPNAGSEFMGCSRFPKCRYFKKIDSGL